MLQVRVGLSLNDFLDLKSHRSQGVHHLLGTEEQEVHRNRLSPPFVEMHRFIADVEGEKE